MTGESLVGGVTDDYDNSTNFRCVQMDTTTDIILKINC